MKENRGAYSVAFVDEEDESVDDLKDAFEAAGLEDTVLIYGFKPLATLEELTDSLISARPDAVIADFRLNENTQDLGHNVPYTGLEVLNGLLTDFPTLPCFLITSYDSDAIKEAKNVNIVYSKGTLHSSESGARGLFPERVKCQIDSTRKLFETMKLRFDTLISASMEKTLNLSEREELELLDSQLEGALCARRPVPKALKSESAIATLAEMVRNTKEILSKLESDEK